MFEAEIRGKKEEESILLSRAFGTLKIVNRDVLKFLLEDLGIDISAEELKSATFRFWEKYAEDDARIPDVII